MKRSEIVSGSYQAFIFSLCIFLFYVLVSCAQPIQGKDRMIETAPYKRTGIFNSNYQKMASCFDGHPDKIFGIEGGNLVIYSDLGIAEFSLGQGAAYYKLVQFKRLSENSTQITSYSVLNSMNKKAWKAIDSCGAKLTAKNKASGS